MPTITPVNAAAFRRPLFRLDPVRLPHQMKTYELSRQPDKLIAAVCEQVGCLAWRNGWETTCDERVADGYVTEDGQRIGGYAAAAYIRHEAGRTFREQRRGDGLTVFRFSSRQRCFRDHQTQPTLYVVRQGDWRAYGRTTRHSGPDAWVNDFASHQERLAGVRS